MIFFRSKRGEIITFVPVTAILFFVTFTGMALMHLTNVRTTVDMAAREGARNYGITHTSSQAVTSIWTALQNTLMVPTGAPLPVPQGNGQYTSSDRHITSLALSDDGTWVKCTITYNYLNPNPFRNLPKLMLSSNQWRPNGFSFAVVGAAKHEN